MVHSLLAGAILAILTIGIHAISTSALVDYLRRNGNRFKTRFGETRVLAMTAVGLLLIHTIEVVLWASAYFWFVGSAQFSRFEDAVYFSTVTFTSLGYGDIVITGSWRTLSAIQAMVGLLVFGWSTALLFAVVQKIWQSKYDVDEN